MPVFLDTLIAEYGAIGDHELPDLMGDAILGQKAALEKASPSITVLTLIGAK